MEKLKLTVKQQKLMEGLFIKGKVTVRQMNFPFISGRDPYAMLEKLVEKDLVSQSYVKNFSGRGHKYLLSYELTEKGKKYISNRNGEKNMEEKSGKMKVVAVYKWDSNKDDWVLKQKDEADED